jgi:hypothetical protein
MSEKCEYQKTTTTITGVVGSFSLLKRCGFASWRKAILRKKRKRRELLFE